MPKGVYDHKPMPIETRIRISKTTKGRKKSAEHAAHISKGKNGKPRPDMAKENNWRWKDTDAQYGAVHYRAHAVLPMECAHADGSCKGMFDVAFRHDAPIELVRNDDPFERPYYAGDPLDGYMRLCRSHHRRYDRS